MNRTELITMFRNINPEMTVKRLSNSISYNWCEVGDKDVCAKSRCIVGEKTFDAVVGVDIYDLTDTGADWYIEKFFDIDEHPGGGVSYDDNRLKQTTIAELDDKTPSWRTNSDGTPEKYYRRSGKICLETPPDTANEIKVYTVLIADDFDNSSKTPFNQLSYLEPYHYAIVLYLTMRAKWKIGKREDAETAEAEYNAYISWMVKQLGGGKYGPIRFGKK